MNRRTFLLSATATVAVVATGTTAWLTASRSDALLSVEEALAALDALNGKKLINAGSWSAGQVFTHIAQSVEFSMSGYPVARSALFQNTAGRIAFAVFSSRGRMSHRLDEAIPGAPLLASSTDTDAAIARVRTALADFAAYQGPLQPHFAYGALSHEQYAMAHAMHLHNHLETVAVAS